MRASVQVADDIIVIDGEPMIVDCTGLRKLGVSAIQWYGERGEIEFERHHKPNETITDMASLQTLIEAARPIPSPTPPTPQQLDEMHNRFLLEHPDWRKPWRDRDDEIKRLNERAGLVSVVPKSANDA
jgi:hypothetical protein